MNEEIVGVSSQLKLKLDLSEIRLDVSQKCLFKHKTEYPRLVALNQQRIDKMCKEIEPFDKPTFNSIERLADQVFPIIL